MLKSFCIGEYVMKKDCNAFSFDPEVRWIWMPEKRKNQFVSALGVLELPSIPDTAQLKIFADTKYKLYMNGRFVNAGPAHFRKPVVYVDEYDVSPFLKEGRNEIFVLAHFIGVTVKYNMVEEPGLAASLSASCGDRVFTLRTGAGWSMAELNCWKQDVPRRNWAIEHIEDVTVEHPSFAILSRYASDDYAGGFNKNIDDFSLWVKPHVFERNDLELRPRAVPILAWTRETISRPDVIYRTNTEIYSLQDTGMRLDHELIRRELDEAAYEMTRSTGVKIERREGEPGFALLYDMRRMCAGDVGIEIFCDNACTVDFALAENLRTDGHPIVWRNGSLHFSRYHLSAGLNRIRTYHFNGHRYLYVLLKDFTGSVEVRGITTYHCRAMLEFRDKFACEDRMAESLYRISRRSIALNTQSNTYDCNTREQGTYWGDSIWITDSVGHQTGDFSHMRQLCYAMSDEFNALGILSASLYGMGGLLLDYCLVPVALLERYYRYTGDVKTVEDNLPVARAIVEQFRSFGDSSGLIAAKNIPDEICNSGECLIFLDHPGNGWHPMTTTGIDRRDYNAGFNLYFLQALQALAELESGEGQKDKLFKEIETLTKTIRETFFVERYGLLKDSAPAGDSAERFSQIANALAVTTGILQGTEARYALSLIMDIHRNSYVSQGTPYTYFFLADAASKLGMAELTTRVFCRDYSNMLERGATTTWEAWNAENHDSLNHAWSAPFPMLTRAGIMGITPGKPGYRVVNVAPQLNTFNTFEGTCCIPQGDITVSWSRISPDEIELAVNIPEGVNGILKLPGADDTVSFKSSWNGCVACSFSG